MSARSRSEPRIKKEILRHYQFFYDLKKRGDIEKMSAYAPASPIVMYWMFV